MRLLVQEGKGRGAKGIGLCGGREAPPPVLYVYIYLYALAVSEQKELKLSKRETNTILKGRERERAGGRTRFCSNSVIPDGYGAGTA